MRISIFLSGKVFLMVVAGVLAFAGANRLRTAAQAPAAMAPAASAPVSGIATGVATAPASAPAAGAALPQGAWSMGISSRQLRQCESAIAWAVGADGQLSADKLQLLDAANRPLALGAAGFCAVTNPFTQDPRVRVISIPANATPGVYRLVHGDIPLGEVTVVPAWPVGVEREVGRLVDLNAAIAAAGEGDTLLLPRGTVTISSTVYLTKHLTIRGDPAPNGTTVILGPGQLSVRADCAFADITFQDGNQRHPLVFMYGNWRTSWTRCRFVGVAVNAGGGPLPNAAFSRCVFEEGAGVALASSTVVGCRFSGWPAKAHPLTLTGGECVLALCEFDGTERAVCGGNISQSLFLYNRFTRLNINRNNEGECILIEDGDLTNCYFGGHRFVGCRGPALQCFGGPDAARSRAITVRGNMFEDFSVESSACAIVLSNFLGQPKDAAGKATGGICNNVFRSFTLDRCAQAAALSSPDGTTTGNTFGDFLITGQQPVRDHNGNATPVNPWPVVAGVTYTQAGNMVTAGEAIFTPAATAGTLTLPERSPQKIRLIYVSPTQAQVGGTWFAGNWRGVLAIEGQRLFYATDGGNTGDRVTVVRGYTADPLSASSSNMVFSNSVVIK